jgi:hypothetical protein
MHAESEAQMKKELERYEAQLVHNRAQQAKNDSEQARLGDRLLRLERQAEDDERLIADLQHKLEGALETNRRDQLVLHGNHNAMESVRVEVDSLSRALADQRTANIQVVKENKDLVREVRVLEERNKMLLDRLQAEEDRVSENDRLVESVQREASDLAAVCATREREVSEASRALVEAQGDLAKATLRMRTDEQEVSRVKHDMDVLAQKLQHSTAKLEEMTVKADKEARAKDQAKKEVRTLEEELFTLKRRVGHMSSELEETREALLRAQDEAARSSDTLRDLRVRGIISTDGGPGGAGGGGGGSLGAYYGDGGHSGLGSGLYGSGLGLERRGEERRGLRAHGEREVSPSAGYQRGERSVSGSQELEQAAGARERARERELERERERHGAAAMHAIPASPFSAKYSVAGTPAMGGTPLRASPAAGGTMTPNPLPLGSIQ